ncbi:MULTISPECIES: PDZ domain-containing protein [unclassified Parafrankia]|uniref:YlbL family protein n=1 Tax=unclassified Parafrankia TaxID=2994368 RepID=UPI000DA5AF53|nr:MULTISPECIES: PDZ domain-containing protein [unclassified Parafrankia]TCJ40324.1 PDZ domain-containing protein [Parafrankia sp. BMG5.11]CAI7973612.1 Lon-like protease [Frankia sp. Hr75.2]SQD99647.1 Peptidase S16 lon domain protein [Parafrankia sp. Ea1.12]
MGRRAQTLFVASVLTLILAVAGLWLPVPFVTFAPGPVTDTLGKVDGAPLIEIDGRRTYPTAGSLELTTVEETPRLNLLGALQDWFASDRAVVPSELVRPPGSSQEQIRQENTQAMIDSQDQATAAALSELGIAPTGAEVVVHEVLSDSPAQGLLRAGDVITSVGGVAITGQDGLREQIGRVKPGEVVEVAYRRDGTAGTGRITTKPATDDPTRPMIGVTTTEKRSYPFTVRIRISDIGGPSAGLMFALGIVDLLTPGELTGGKTVAGTGTIDAAGEVGPIGGIQQKILGAQRAGASVFLVPKGNCADAVRMNTDLRLVQVTNLSGALDALNTLRAKPDATNVPTCSAA